MSPLSEEEFERAFLLDYFWFGRMVLPHEAVELSRAHDREMHPDRKRALFLATHTIFVQECEHVAAWILAIKGWAENGTALVETLLRYGPGDASLEKVLGGFRSGHELLAGCGIRLEAIESRICPRPDLDSRVNDIWGGLTAYAEEQRRRADAYNKSKHGMMYFSSPKVINPSNVDGGPIAIYAENRRADPLNVLPAGLDYSEDQPRIIAKQTEKLAEVLGDLLLFYLLQQHPCVQAEISELMKTKMHMIDVAR